MSNTNPTAKTNHVTKRQSHVTKLAVMYLVCDSMNRVN